MYSKVIKARIIQSVFYIRVGDKKPMVDELRGLHEHYHL